jgi:hypothetical protein
VNLEQRGSGLSYYPFSKDKNLAIHSIVDDVYQFALYLLERLKQDQLILTGTFLGYGFGLVIYSKTSRDSFQIYWDWPSNQYEEKYSCSKEFCARKDE